METTVGFCGEGKQPKFGGVVFSEKTTQNEQNLLISDTPPLICQPPPPAVPPYRAPKKVKDFEGRSYKRGGKTMPRPLLYLPFGGEVQ